MEKTSIEQLQKIASQVRRDISPYVHAVQSEPLAHHLGCTEFLCGTYFSSIES